MLFAAARGFHNTVDRFDLLNSLSVPSATGSFQRLCEVPNYVKMLPARQLFQALEALIASHSFLTLQVLELAQQQV